jgi:hypothetical protein
MRRKAMQSAKRSRRPIRDILALAVVALCALTILAALIRPGAGFEPLLPLVVGAIVIVVRHYFERRS